MTATCFSKLTLMTTSWDGLHLGAADRKAECVCIGSCEISELVVPGFLRRAQQRLIGVFSARFGVMVMSPKRCGHWRNWLTPGCIQPLVSARNYRNRGARKPVANRVDGQARHIAGPVCRFYLSVSARLVSIIAKPQCMETAKSAMEIAQAG